MSSTDVPWSSMNKTSILRQNSSDESSPLMSDRPSVSPSANGFVECNLEENGTRSHFGDEKQQRVKLSPPENLNSHQISQRTRALQVELIEEVRSDDKENQPIYSKKEGVTTKRSRPRVDTEVKSSDETDLESLPIQEKNPGNAIVTKNTAVQPDTTAMTFPNKGETKSTVLRADLEIDALVATLKKDSGLSGLTPDEILERFGVETGPHDNYRFKGREKLTPLQRTKILRAISVATLPKTEIASTKLPKRLVEETSPSQPFDETSFFPTCMLFLSFNNPMFINCKEALSEALQDQKITAIYHNCPDHCEYNLSPVCDLVMKRAVDAWSKSMKFGVIVTADPEYPTSILTTFLSQMRLLCNRSTMAIHVARMGVYEIAKKNIQMLSVLAAASGAIFSKELEPSDEDVVNEVVSYLRKDAALNPTKKSSPIHLCNDPHASHEFHKFCNCYIASTKIDGKIWPSVERYLKAQGLTQSVQDEEMYRALRKAIFHKVMQHRQVKNQLMSTYPTHSKLETAAEDDEGINAITIEILSELRVMLFKMGGSRVDVKEMEEMFF